MPIVRNFNDLFILPEMESEKIENDFLTNLHTGSIDDIAKALHADKIFLEDYCICNAINEFTKDIPYTEIVDSINILTKCKPYITNIDFSSKNLEIDTTDKKIKVRKFTDIFPQFSNNYDLYSDLRLGQCHSKAVELAHVLPIKHDVVTGYYCSLTNNLKYLHSWIEININEKEPVVIDYTMNAVINKSGYYQFRHIYPLCRISNNTIKKDLALLKKELFYKDLTPKEYLVFRDRIMNNLMEDKDFYGNEI